MFQHEFMVHMILGTALVGVVCAFLGVFVVLRRAVFVGASLAQVSSLGVALSFFICGEIGEWLERDIHMPPQPFALALTVAVSALLALQFRERRVPRDTGIGVIYAAASGLAILVVATSAHVHAEVLNLLFGNVLTIDRGTVIGLAALVAVMGVVHWLFRKEFLFASFDPEAATAAGVRAKLWNVLLFITIGVTISLTINAAGALVVFNFLVLPAATALLVGKNLRAVTLVAVIIAVVAGFLGITLSFLGDLPTGPTIVAVNAALLLAAWLFKTLFARA